MKPSWRSILFLFVSYVLVTEAQDAPAGGSAPQPPAAGGGGGGGGGGYQKQYGGQQPQPQPQSYGGQQSYGGGSKSYGGGGFVAPPPYPLPPVSVSCDIDPNCWQYAVECSAADAYPFERHACGTCEECLALCQKNQAKGGGLGTPLGLTAGASGGCGGGCGQQRSYGGGGGCGGGGCGGGGGGGCGGGGCGAPAYGPPQQQSYGGQQPQSYAGRNKRQGGCGGGPCPYYCQSVVFDAQYKTCDLFAVNAPKLKKYPGRAYFQSTGLCGNKTQNGTAAPAAASCPDGQSAKVIAVKGSTLSSFSGKDAAGVTSEDACAQACLKNALPDGTAITCKSAQFSGGKCQYSDQAGVQSQDVKAGDGTYFKKYCFPSALVANCPDIWEEDPQKILVGQNRLTVDASTYDQCLQACLDSQKQNGFACKSGMFFYAEQKLNCILNVESKATRPDLFTDAGEGDVVVYFDPNCGGGSTRAAAKKTRTLAEALRDIPLVGEWTLWSPCEGTWLNQVRFRQCRELDPRRCEREERSCDPAQRSTTTAAAATPTTEKEDEKEEEHHEEMTKTAAKSTATSKPQSTSGSSKHTAPPSKTAHREVAIKIKERTPSKSTALITTPLPPIDDENNNKISDARLIDINNEVRRADAVSGDGACRAVRKNGVKNCRLGVRMVGGLKRYCSSPIDC